MFRNAVRADGCAQQAGEAVVQNTDGTPPSPGVTLRELISARTPREDTAVRWNSHANGRRSPARPVTHCLTAALLLLLWGRVARGETTCLDHAVQFLVQQQDDMGLWSSGGSRRRTDTEAVVSALDEIAEDTVVASVLRGRAALTAELPYPARNVRDLVTELVLFSSAGAAHLLHAMNADGGWGGTPAQSSNPIDTVIAAETLIQAGHTPSAAWNGTTAYLADSRSPDGWWTLADEPASGTLVVTARVLRCLVLLRGTGAQHLALTSMIAETRALLLSQHQADGGFAPPFDDPNAASSVLGTAEVLRALCLIDPPGTHADSLRFLLSQQETNGSWREAGAPETDIYTTALVVRLLKELDPPKATDAADLAVVVAGISFVPSLPRPGDAVRIRAVVFNRGNGPSCATTVRFTLGDPRTGGILIGSELVLPELAVGASALVSADLDTNGLVASPLLGVAVDPANAVPEADEGNNIALCRLRIEGLPETTPPQGIDLYIGSASLTVNNKNPDTPVSLSDSRTVVLAATIANTGTETASDVVVEIRDGVTLIGRGTVSKLLPGASTSQSFLWRPGAGPHSLSLSVDPENAVQELDETNNTAAFSVNITVPVSSLSVHRMVDGAELAPPLLPYDTARISVSSAYAGAVAAVSVRSVAGAGVAIPPVPLATPGVFQWSVANQAPGDCIVTATLSSAETGVVLATLTETVGVLQHVALRTPRVFLSRTSAEPGQLDPITVTVGLQNGSNEDAQWLIGWKLISPGGTVVAASSQEQAVLLLAAQMTRMVELDEHVAGTISLPGSYRVEVMVRHESGTQAAGNAVLAIEPGLRVLVTNRLLPARVQPVSTARITTQLRLAAVDTSGAASLPAAIGKVSASPSASLQDSAATSVTLQAEAIVNGFGEAVPDGTLVALHAPYGTLAGGTALPNDGNPKVRLYATSSATITATYSPGGDALSTGASSVLVLRFLQCTDAGAGALGREIGHTEVYLTGD